jgi:hypothetical protein
MKFLSELYNDQIETLVENTATGKKYFLEGKFLSGDTPNRNRRIYRKSVLENAVGKYVDEFLTKKRALGELDHPASGPTVNLSKVSHVIESLEFRGSDVYGKARILSTPNGEITKSLIDEGIQLGVSTRGLGSLINRNGLNEVQSDFYLSAVDIVSDPSGIGCYVNPLMESMNWKMIGENWVPDNTDEKLRLFAEFLKNIK